MLLTMVKQGLLREMCLRLHGNAVFLSVTDGMEHVDKIKRGEPAREPAKMQMEADVK